MPLEDYQRKRDFGKTPEPPGAARDRPSGRLFVIHKHAARRLHYDLRLELDGVLLSWAVPKGPSMDPSEKRLAVQTEDHPLEYGEFEGIIPEGEYGGGTVMLWDRGEWSLTHGAIEDLREGMLKFTLVGEKMHGDWALVRIGGKKKPDSKEWLLLKERDGLARPESEYCLLDEMPRSVATGRTMREIAADQDNIWMTRQAAVVEDGAHASIPGAQPAPFPEARAARPFAPGKTVPSGDEWLHEIMMPGCRLTALLTGERVILLNDAAENWTHRLPAVARSVSRIPVATAVIDGQIVVLRPDGSADEGLLEDVMASRAKARVTYRVFDISYCQGMDLTATPLIERKRFLESLISSLAGADTTLTYSDHIAGQGEVVQEHARRLGVGTIISRRADGVGDRNDAEDWLEIHCASTDDAVEVSQPAAPVQSAIVVQPAFRIAGVAFTNPDRVYYPDEKITKRDVALYYEQVADWILPHVTGRALSLVRCPKGFENERFYQKHLTDVELEHVRHVTVQKQRKEEIVLVIDDLAGLMTCVQLAALEIHPWGSRIDQPDRPDRIVFDLDPGPDVGWPQIVESAREVRDLLAELALESYVKTSGGKGLHVVVPIVRRSTWQDVKAFSRGVSNEMVRRSPRAYTATISKSARPGRIFIDYLRNVQGATCVGTYSSRALAGAPVSTPLAWDELSAEGHAGIFTVDNFSRRLASLAGDPWAGFFESKQSITAKMWAKLGLKKPDLLRNAE